MQERRSAADESVASLLATVEMFSSFSKAELQQLAVHADSRWYDFGDAVFDAGQKSTGVYVIRSGTVRLFSEERGKEISMGVRAAGDVLAEIGALREHKHESSVRASAKTELLHISREAFAPILAANKDAASFLASYTAIRMAGGAVSRLFDLRGKVDQNELTQLVRSIGVKRVTAGATVVTQGATDDRRLYLVRQGKVKTVREEGGTQYVLGVARQGELFGEASALSPTPQASSAIAETDAVLLVIPTDTLRFIIDRKPQVKDFLEERIKTADREMERQRQLAERRGGRALMDISERAGIGEKILPRFALVEQAEESDCGAACLAMVCKHHGVAMTLGKLREMANVTTEGATLDSLARVGESLGFTTRGMKCTFESLLGFELPFIAHWEGYHYIVVYGISKRHVWVADPARGFAKMAVADFEKGWTGLCLLFTPSADLAKNVGVSPWVRFVGYLSPFRSIVAHILLATLVIELLGVAPPIIVQNVIDRVAVHHNAHLLHVLIIGLVITHVFTRLTTLMRGMLANYMRRNLDFAMISQFFRHTLSLPLAFFNKRRTGDIFARFQENMKVRSFLTESTISTLLNVLMTFIYFVVMFLYSVQLSLLLIAFLVPLGLLTAIVTPRIKQFARKAFESSTDAESMLMETLTGAETVKAMGIERPMRLRWESRYAKALEVQYRAQRFDLMVGFTGQLLSAASSVVILWIGASMVLAGTLTIGQLIAFTMLMGSAISPVMGLIGLWDQLQETGVAMERLGDVLDIEPEQKPSEIDSRVLLPALKGDIRFDNVFFRYGGTTDSRFVLESVRFSIQPGQLVAIVGQSGSGKTTLAKLIAGFYPATEGAIYIDGYDINIVEKEYYRSQLGYVMQNNLLFSGTVAENIAAGEENPDRRRVVEVAKMADAHGFVSAMPLGYEQLVGERGMGLSGGQMQRLCIARALYHDPRVLILDEATSALDSQSESNILQNLQSVFQGRTSIVIAHRLSTIMNADKILVLYNGSIVEEGVHKELYDRRGMYHQLVQKQMTGTGG